MIDELKSYSISVDVVDCYADQEEVKHEYGFDLLAVPSNDYDAVVIAVNHDKYTELNEAAIKKMMKDDKGVLIDIKGIFRNEIKELTYWSF